MMKTIFMGIMMAVFFSSPADAYKLNADQLNRARIAQELLSEVETRSADEIISDLEESARPEAQLVILEAIARTYQEMVEEYDVTTQERKKWLHSMVLLNMAYFQLGGTDDQINDTALNIVIRRKLKTYLPPAIFDNKELFYTLDD